MKAFQPKWRRRVGLGRGGLDGTRAFNSGGALLATRVVVVKEDSKW
jgi:hypothetical protein